MPTKRRSSFDPKAFLANVGEGRSIVFGGDRVVHHVSLRLPNSNL